MQREVRERKSREENSSEQQMPCSSRWKALLSEYLDTEWVQVEFGEPLAPLQVSKAKRVQNIKDSTEMNLKTRIGTGTWNKSCKLRGLGGPGRQCQKSKCRSMWVSRKWQRVWQTLRHIRWLSSCWLDLQFPDLLSFVVFCCCFHNEAGNLAWYVTFPSF